MGYYEFPHTRNYDTDLGYLIKRYFELSTDFESLEKNFNDLKAWCLSQLNSEALKTLIANKLDEWLQDGTLESLINNPLNHVTTYDTIVEMITHSGLLEGSKIYCTGADKVNDGKGGHFRIRARLSTDNIDNYNLYLIDGGIKVAERLNDSKNNKKYIFIGDSYADREISWITYLVNLLGLKTTDYFKSVHGGYGFHPKTYRADFITLITNLETVIENKNEITDIIVQGGFNDSKTESDVLWNAITDFCNYCKTNYPNATVKVGAFGWSFNAEFVDELNFGNYIQVYKRVNELDNALFINGSEYIMHNFSLYLEEPQGEYSLQLGKVYVHPNNDGSKEIANCIYANLNNKIYHYQLKTKPTLTLASGVTLSNTEWNAVQTLDDNIISMFFTTNLNFQFSSPKSPGTDYIELGTLPNGLIAGNKDTGDIRCGTIINCNGFVAANGKNINIPISLFIIYNHLYAKVFAENITNIFIFNGNGVFDNKYC